MRSRPGAPDALRYTWDVLSELEADVLLAVEGHPHVEGVWRIPAARSDSSDADQRPLVIVVVDSLQAAVHVLDLPNAHRVDWLRRPVVSIPPNAELITLDPASRATAEARRARYRASERWAPVPLPPYPPEPPPRLPSLRIRPLGVRESPLARAALRLARKTAPPSPAPLPHDDGRDLADTRPMRVAVVTRDPELFARIQRAATTGTRVVRLESGWELLDPESDGYDRIFWESDETDPQEAKLVRLLGRERPKVARALFFVVGPLRFRRMEMRNWHLNHRFLCGLQLEFERVMRDEPPFWTRSDTLTK